MSNQKKGALQIFTQELVSSCAEFVGNNLTMMISSTNCLVTDTMFFMQNVYLNSSKLLKMSVQFVNRGLLTQSLLRFREAKEDQTLN